MTVALPAHALTRPLWARFATALYFLGNGLALGTWAANLPRLREAQHLNDASLGLVLLAFGVGALAMVPFAGAVAARFGAGRVAAATSIAFAVLLPLPGVVDSWWLLLAIAAANGALNANIDVSMNAQAAVVERHWGAAIMSSFHAGWSAGGLLGALLAGLFARAGWSLPAALILPAAVMAVLAAVGATAGVREEAVASSGPAFVLPSRAMFALTAIAGLSFASEGGVADWSGVYLRTDLGTDTAVAASAFGAYSLAMATSRLAGDVIVRRLGPVRVLRFGALLAAVSLATALLVPSVVVMDAALIFVGIGLSNVVPVVFSAAGRREGTRGVAMVATLGYASLLVAPPVLGGVAQGAGLRTALGILVAAMGSMAALAGAARA